MNNRAAITALPRQSERGSALVYIFIGVVLFGALMFMYVRSSSTSGGDQSQSSAAPKAIEIMERSETIVRAVDRLLSKGCSINQLNFHSDHYTQAGTTNPDAPADGSCDVYSPSGGKIKWEGCPDSSLCSDQYVYTPKVPRSLVVTGIGTVPEDLVYVVLVRKDVCLAINSKLGLPTTDLPYTAIDGSPYIGTFSKDNLLPGTIGGNFTAFQGKSAGCLYMKNYMDLWGGEFFVYYRVLAAL